MAETDPNQNGSAGAQSSASPAATTTTGTPLDQKIRALLGDRVILKPLTRWNEAYKEFPRFVMEYLVSRYVKPTDPVAGQAKIDKILSEHYAALQYPANHEARHNRRLRVTKFANCLSTSPRWRKPIDSRAKPRH